MWIMVAGPYRPGAETGEARADEEAARFRALGRPVSAALEEVPTAR